MGLMAAHPDVPSQLTESDLKKAWPKTKSEKKRLGIQDYENERYGSQKFLTMPDDYDDDMRSLGYDGRDAEPFRALSEATKEADWQDGPFGEQTIHMDRAISRALAFDDSVDNLDVLFRKEIFDTVIEGARKAEIARDATTLFPVDRDQGDHPRGPDTRFAPDVAEGAAIEDDAANHDTVSWDTDRFGRGAAATDKLIRQSLVSVIEQNIEDIGHSVEMKANRLFLNELLDNVDTTNDVDASSEDNKGVASINEAIHQIALNDEEADAAVMHPTFTKTLFDTAESNAIIPKANEFGDDEGVRDRVAFPLLGIEGFRGSDGVYDPDGSNTWNYTGANETGAVVYDSDRVGMYLFNDIEMKEYEDPIRDLQAVNARMEVDFVWHKNDAGARINHS